LINEGLRCRMALRPIQPHLGDVVGDQFWVCRSRARGSGSHPLLPYDAAPMNGLGQTLRAANFRWGMSETGLMRRRADSALRRAS
jgi:hypothetical protein